MAGDIPVRVGDDEWMREHRSRSAKFDIVESAHHCDFHRRNKRVRFDVASGHVGWSEAHCSGSALPFVSMFRGHPSSYLWGDAVGKVHTIS